MVFRQLPILIACFVAALPAPAATIRADGPSIYTNEIEVLRFRATVAGKAPADRASYLASILSGFTLPASVKVISEGTSFRIVVGDKPWVLVGDEEAKAAATSPRVLAESWAANLDKALELPAVKVSQSQAKLPPGAMRSFALVGSKAQEAAVRSTNENVFKVTRSGATLTLHGVAPGRAQAQIAAGSQIATVDVTVQPMAAYFPQTITAVVTGTPASRDTVAGALMASLNSELKAIDGASVSFNPPTVTEIGTGESRTYQVRVNVSGPEAFPSGGLVNVVVKNSPIGYRSETELWYCNYPEQIKKPMRVFVAALRTGAPVRMLYHHINRSSSALIMNVEAINNSNTPARVLIIPGDAEPDRNPVVAGFNAADQFVRAWSKYSGEVVDIPPYSVLPISMRKMNRDDTVSGLCYMRLLEGGPDLLVVRAEARGPSLMDHKWIQAMSSSTPWRITGCKKIGDLASVPTPDTEHIYPNPFKIEDVDYRVGGPYGFVRIGQSPIARQDNQSSLDGNFGVIYTINANIENKTSLPVDIEVVYEASAGYSGALFLINGEVRRTPMLQPKEETRLSRFRLEANSTKALKIMTLPLSGSSYPSTLTIRPVQPLAHTAAGGKT